MVISTLHAETAAVSQLYVGLTSDGEIDSVPDLKEQVSFFPYFLHIF